MPVGAATLSYLIPSLVSAIGIGAGGNANRKNRKFQNEQNEKDRQYGWDMYWRQREDSLGDWNMQNQYDSPYEQMKRFKEAGLNPNLIYGQQTHSPAVRSAQPGTGNQPAQKVDNSYISESLGQFFNIQQQKAQTDNIHQQTMLSLKQGTLTDANIQKVLAETATNQFDLEKAREMRQTVIEQAQANLNKTNVETSAIETSMQISLDHNEREKLSNAVNVKKTLEEIIELKLQHSKTQVETLNEKLRSAQTTQETQNLQVQYDKLKAEIKQLEQMTSASVSDQQLKILELELRKVGINPHDSSYSRYLMMLLSGMSIEQIIQHANKQRGGTLPNGDQFIPMQYNR